jgi:hypothetical protein
VLIIANKLGTFSPLTNWQKRTDTKNNKEKCMEFLYGNGLN